MNRSTSLVLCLAATCALVACGGPSQPAQTGPDSAALEIPPEPIEPDPIPDTPVNFDDEPEPKQSAAVTVPLQAKSGSKLSGTATLTEVDGGVKVTLEVENATPGEHGAHIHEKADCSAPDAKSAGGHFNPEGHEHGLPAKDKRHLGDLGNITVDKDGTGKHEIVIEGANLDADDKHSFLGRAVIIHANKDDGGQPAGNAGKRVGCGEIKASE